MSHQSTILIVDDEPSGRELLGALLARQDYQLAFACSGAEALEQAAALSPDVILLDVMMPGIDGFEVCRRIRATPDLADVAVLLLTALDDRDSRLRGLEAGADDFISKPFDRVELRARVRTITRLNRARRLMIERENFGRVVDLSPDGLLIVDAGEIIRLANPAICRLLGVESDAEVVGAALRTLVAPEALDRTSDTLGRIFGGTDQVARFEITLSRCDGTHVVVEADAGLLLWNSGAAAQIVVRDIAERKQGEARAQREVTRLGALRSIDAAITSGLDLPLTLGLILDQTIDHLQIDAAAVLLRAPYTQAFEYAATRGVRREALPHAPLSIGAGCAGYVALHRRHLRLPADSSDALAAQLQPPLGAEFPAYYGVPLIIKGQVEGVFELFHREPHAPDAEWLHFLETLAGQTAVAIEHAMLFQSMQRSHAELIRAYDTTLEGWARALELRDKETEGHAQRVTELTVRLARRMGLGEADLAHIRRGALLHDIGKMGIPDSILLKPGPLTDDEWVIMRRHPVMAYELLAPVAYLRPALDIPYFHHERWDGSGYPRGLQGEEIPLAARIFAVVDVWDALRYDRPYRQGWPEAQVRARIRELSGTHFDPRVVEAFLNLDAQELVETQLAILIVDDDDDIAEALRRSLCDQYTVYTASSGVEALETLAREEIAVIVADQRMPGLSGVQVLERARHVQPATLGIICSAHLDSAALSEALNIGTVRGFIHKPWSMVELRRRVSEVARLYRSPACDNVGIAIS
jgi:PAS domain S-box-containing protein/putative nucleotidyltransferase with HDIG domain